MQQKPEPDFEFIFNSLPGNIIVLEPNDPYYTILALSNDALSIKGYDRKDIVGRSLFDAFPEEMKTLTTACIYSIKESLQYVNENKKQHQIQVVFSDSTIKGGGDNEYNITVTNKPVLNETGEIAYIIQSYKDISSHITIKNQQVDQKAYLQNAINIANLGTYKVDLVSDSSTHSEIVRDWFGLDGLQNRKDEIFAKIYHEDVEKVDNAISKSLQSEEHSRHDVTYRVQPDTEQSIHYVRSIGKTLFKEGVPHAIVGILQDITSQINVQLELKENEQQVRAMLESAPFPIAVYTGKEMKLKYANRSMIKAYGKGNDVIGKKYADILPEISPEIHKRLDDVYNTGIPFQSENEFMHIVVDGKPQQFYYSYNFTPLLNGEGKVYGVMITAVDVTEFNLAHKKTEESSRELRRLANAMPQIVWIANANGDVTYYNDRVSEFAGAIKLPDGTWSWEGLLHPDDTRPTVDAWRKALEEGAAYEIEHRLQMLDGSYRWHLSRAFPQRNSKGEVEKWYGTATDVHQQKENEETLKRFKFMADQAHDAFILMRADGSFAYLNELALQRWGYTQEEAATLKVPDVDVIYHELKFKETFDTAQKQEILPFETLHKRKDGTIYPVEVSLGGITLGGEPHMFAVARDITDRKLAEETLMTRNMELQTINNDLDNFIYTASHDLKAPISNIEGLLALLADNYESDNMQNSETIQIMDMMHVSVERFKKTIATLADVVKLQQENAETAVMVNLQDVIQEVSLDLEPVMQAADVELELKVDACIAIPFSEKNMRSVIYNLLSNAIKYRSPDRRSHILIQCHTTPENHVLTIKDNGLGIEGPLDKLFSMFSRFHDHVEGTGIGLYMVKKMVENAGGHIKVESQPNEGSAFHVYFKL